MSDNGATSPRSDGADGPSPKRLPSRSARRVAAPKARSKKKKKPVHSPSMSSEANLSGAPSPLHESTSEASAEGVASASGTSTPVGRRTRSAPLAQISPRGPSSASDVRDRAATPDAIDRASESLGIAQDSTDTTTAAPCKSVRAASSPTSQATGTQSPAEVQDDKYTIAYTSSSFLTPPKPSKNASGTASPTPQANGSQKVSPADVQDDKLMTPYTTSSLLSRPGLTFDLENIRRRNVKPRDDIR
ncbi:uncharacterized protein LOC144119504 [Amblyomma americanum]